MTRSQIAKSGGAKLPPHSQEAEQSVLGALMLDQRSWDRIADRITAADFYRQDHQLIYQTIGRLVEGLKPVDVLTVSDALKSTNSLEKAGGEAYLFELAKNTPSAANIVAYADIVREYSILRQLIEIGTDITQDAFNPDGREVKELLDKAESRVFGIAEQGSAGSGPVDISTLLAKTTERIDALGRIDGTLTGASTGYRDLDNITMGLQPADMVVVAGRPSMGKTVFGINLAEHVALKTGRGVLIFSLEMPAEAIVMRMLSSLTRIEQNKIRTGKLTDEDWARVSSTVGMLSETSIYIDDTPALSPSDMRARARRVARSIENGLGLIVVDYLQLMQVAGYKENRTNEIAEISRSLKALAKELNVPVIALSQLNRSLESRTDKRPVMSDLRESGSIEQDADLIAFIYRDEVYHPETAEKGHAEVIIAKQRNGPIGKINLTFRGALMRFDDYIPQSATVGVSFGEVPQ